MIRTTVSLDENVFKQARKKAIDDGVAFARIVDDALKSYLKGRNKFTKKFEVKVFSMGSIKTELNRKELYKDV